MKKMEDITISDVPLVAQYILDTIPVHDDRSTVVGLVGDLGAGKTTLVQAIAKQLQINETVMSPTYVIMKRYKAHQSSFNTLVHMDAYRLNGSNELAALGFDVLLQSPKTLLVIEWPGQISDVLPDDMTTVRIHHTGEDIRTFTIS